MAAPAADPATSSGGALDLLVYLEPVIFRRDPVALRAHFMWVACFQRAAHAAGARFAIAANTDVCEAWAAQERADLPPARRFGINAFAALAAHGFERARYARALFEQPDADDVLVTELRHVVEQFRPALVVMTAQSSIASRAFEGLRTLHIEQAPLPRLGHPLRTAIDPCGHQSGALLERFRARLGATRLSRRQQGQAARLLQKLQDAAPHAHPDAGPALAALAAIRREGPVALLATQPTDGVTFEGAYHPIELENLVYAWAEALPPGWIGVPTYHPGQRIEPALEQALGKACGRLRFLPGSLAQGLTEALLAEADGLVTISSTSAMTALLFGVPAIVTGRSPFAAWCAHDPGQLASATTLPPDQRVTLLAFLTHRFAYRHDELMAEPGALVSVLRELSQRDDPAEWMLDLSNWDATRAEALFELRGCGSATPWPGCAHGALQSAVATLTAERDALQAQAGVLREEARQLAQARDALVADVEALRLAATRSEAESRATRDRELALQAELVSARAAARAQDLAQSALQQENSALASSSDALAARAGRLEAELEAGRRALAAAQLDAGRLEQERAALAAARDAAMQRAAALVLELGDLRQQLQAEAEAGATVRRSLQQQEAAGEQFAQQLAAARLEITARQDAVAQLQASIERQASDTTRRRLELEEGLKDMAAKLDESARREAHVAGEASRERRRALAAEEALADAGAQTRRLSQAQAAETERADRLARQLLSVIDESNRLRRLLVQSVEREAASRVTPPEGFVAGESVVALQQALQECRRQFEEYRRAVLDSSSWRLTEPLRRLAAWRRGADGQH